MMLRAEKTDEHKLPHFIDNQPRSTAAAGTKWHLGHWQRLEVAKVSGTNDIDEVFDKRQYFQEVNKYQPLIYQREQRGAKPG